MRKFKGLTPSCPSAGDKPGAPQCFSRLTPGHLPCLGGPQCPLTFSSHPFPAC